MYMVKPTVPNIKREKKLIEHMTPQDVEKNKMFMLLWNKVGFQELMQEIFLRTLWVRSYGCQGRS